MKNKKLLFGICFVVLIVIVSIWFIKINNLKGNENNVRVGVILPLTGPVAADGEDALIGIKIAEKMPICKTNNVEFLVKDSKLDAKETVSAFNLLIADGVDAMIIAGDLSCQVIQPLLDRHSIPVVAPVTGSPDSINQSEWIFRCWTSVEQVSKILALYSRRYLHCQKVAILHIDALHGIASTKAFKECFISSGGKICAQEVFPLVTSDIKTQISKILGSSPDAVYVTGYGLGYVVALNQLREVGFQGIILADAAIDDPRVQINIVDKKDIVYAGNALEENCSVSANATYFCSEYRKIVGVANTKVSPQAPFTFEAAMIFANAFSHERKSRDKIRDYISNLKDFQSILGDISFDKSGEIYFPIYVKKYDTDGTVITLDNQLWKEVTNAGK